MIWRGWLIGDGSDLKQSISDKRNKILLLERKREIFQAMPDLAEATLHAIDETIDRFRTHVAALELREKAINKCLTQKQLSFEARLPMLDYREHILETQALVDESFDLRAELAKLDAKILDVIRMEFGDIDTTIKQLTSYAQAVPAYLSEGQIETGARMIAPVDVGFEESMRALEDEFSSDSETVH